MITLISANILTAFFFGFISDSVKKGNSKKLDAEFKNRNYQKKAICVTQLIFQHRFKIDFSWARESIAMKQ